MTEYKPIETQGKAYQTCRSSRRFYKTNQKVPALPEITAPIDQDYDSTFTERTKATVQEDHSDSMISRKFNSQPQSPLKLPGIISSQAQSPHKLPGIVSRDSSRASMRSFQNLQSLSSRNLSRNQAQNFRNKTKAGTEVVSARQFGSEWGNDLENGSDDELSVHMENFKEKIRQEIVEEESRTKLKASQASTAAYNSRQKIAETLHNENQFKEFERKILQKRDEVIKQREEEFKESEKKRLFLGLHIDRRKESIRKTYLRNRTLKKQKTLKREDTIDENAQLKKMLAKANAKKLKARVNLLDQMGYIEQLK